MTISKSKLLLPLVIIFVGGAVSASASIKVTRSSESDTAIDKCKSGATMPSFFDICMTYGSVNNQAFCINRSRCCKRCRCFSDYPTYLAHLNKCVSLSQLDVFRQGSKGRSNE